MKQFSSVIEYGEMIVNTIVDGPNIAFGETLSGTVYIDGEEGEELIDQIEIELLKRAELVDITIKMPIQEDVIAKYSVEMVSALKSKETWMIPFEMVPDERWEIKSAKEILILRTTVYLKSDVYIQDEDGITYS
ncbi:sporulation protein [Filibacter tadaridae]|uniref:sporulation protein n=1 Tax=Filibacter tadaridae TaxID=2483811 RepID=UPI000F533AAD|nr:sporulation protein [Filibacter tadaridae]